MAVTVPTAIQIVRDVAPDLRRNQDMRAKQLEVVAGNEHRFRARLRGFLNIGGEDITTTSTSFVDVTEERAFEPSPLDSNSVTLKTYGTNADVKLTVDDGTTTITITNSHGGSASVQSGSASVSSLSGTTWFTKLEIKVPSSGTATLSGAEGFEATHTALTIV